jgi:hypothetical protein
VHNKVTRAEFENIDLPGWITSSKWLTDSSFCEWHGVTCNSVGEVTRLQMDSNRMYGIFAPEVQILKESLEVIDLYGNFFLLTEGDEGNSWIGQMSKLKKLFIGSTSFEYTGIPTFIG